MMGRRRTYPEIGAFIVVCSVDHEDWLRACMKALIRRHVEGVWDSSDPRKGLERRIIDIATIKVMNEA